MTRPEAREIVPGTVVEFFESKQVLTGVCVAVKSGRLTVLSEQNREISLAQSRLIHAGQMTLDMKLTRDDHVRKLGAVAAARRQLMEHISLEELWSLLEGEEDAFNVRTLAELVFSSSISDDHVAAVQRVLLQDRLYFQFKDGAFQARSSEKVELRRVELQREEERESRLEEGSKWLETVWNRKTKSAGVEGQDHLVEHLKGFCLFGQEYPDQTFVKELLKRANIAPQPQSAFRLLVRLGVWQEDENLYLHQQNISAEFPPDVIELAGQISAPDIRSLIDSGKRRDFRHLHSFTIDSSFTRDYDDALSLQTLDDGLYEVGIHIADAAEFIGRGDPLDVEAQERASSIYLPDGRISMLPASLSEGLCSLKAGEDRLALSFVLRIDKEGTVREHEIVPSVVNIHEQLNYEEVNERVHQEEYLRVLYELAIKLRNQRLEKGAVILPLPETQLYVNSAGMIQISKHEKETPSQIMVSEWMIAANALAGTFLAENGVPAIFRSQGECKPETDFTQSEHELFRVYRQRRLFARAELDTAPQMHCSLAIPYYTTVTSPIRRYMDLVVQRQLKHLRETREALYGEEELRQLIVKLSALQSKIFQIQRKWTRYWILKYMEQEDMHTLDALILQKNARFAYLLLPDFLMEANAPLPENGEVRPGEKVRVKIERLNPREDLLRLSL
jgi:exoribonuclease-2